MARTRTRSYVAAAIEILRSEGQPLTAKAITERAISQGLIQPAGKTPERTMSSALYTHTLKREDSPFNRVYTQGPNRAVRGSVKWALQK